MAKMIWPEDGACCRQSWTLAAAFQLGCRFREPIDGLVAWTECGKELGQKVPQDDVAD